MTWGDRPFEPSERPPRRSCIEVLVGVTLLGLVVAVLGLLVCKAAR